MGDQVVNHNFGAGHEKTMGGRDVAHGFRQQVVERFDIGLHVAIRRVNDHCRALHDVISGEQQALVHQQVTQVIGGVAGGVQNLEVAGFGADQCPWHRLLIRLEGAIVFNAIRCRPAQHRAVAPVFQCPHRRGMVDVGVGDQDLLNITASQFQDFLDVIVIHRAGVNHGKALMAQ